MKKTNLLKSVAALVASISLCSLTTVLPTNAATYGTREKLVEVAESYIGSTYEDFGYTDNWCAAFAHKCVSEAGGIGYSTSASASRTLYEYEKAGRFHARISASWEYNGTKCVSLTRDEEYTPKVGDIVLIETFGGFGNGPDHAALVVNVSGTGITARVDTIEGNIKGDDNAPDYYKTSCVGRDYWVSEGLVWGYCSPDYSNSSSTVQTQTSSSGVTPIFLTNNVLFKNVTYPIKQKAGGTFNVYGTINTTSKITSVTVDIDEITSTGRYVNVDKTVRYPNTTYYNLHTIDDRIWFNRASKKNTSYRYRITVKTANGKTAYYTKTFKTF